MKKTTKPKATKPTKKQLAMQEHRANRAYAVAVGVMLMTHVDETAVTVHFSSDDYCFRPVYAPTDYRMLIVATLGEIILDRVRSGQKVESDSLYEELLTVPDPNCYFDRMTAEDVKHIVRSTMMQVASKTYAVDSIAEQLLACPQDQETAIVFPPVKRSLSQ